MPITQHSESAEPVRTLRELIADTYAQHGRYIVGLNHWGETPGSTLADFRIGSVAAEAVSRCLDVNTRESRAHARRLLDALDVYQDTLDAAFRASDERRNEGR